MSLAACATPEAAADLAALRWAERFRGSVAERGRFVAALSGGSSAGLLLERLAAPAYAELAWDRAHLFWVDERCVPPDDPRSNYGAARESLLRRVPVPAGQTHRIEGERAPEAAARAYEDGLRRFFGDDPRFDVALMGLGPDGHTASLFPGAPALESERWVEATPPAPVEPRVPRVTLTPKALRRARTQLYVVTGAAKAPALESALAGRGPAGRVRPEDGELLWFVDEAAARPR